MTLGERLRLLREKKGLTQVALAKKLNIPNQNVSNYERDFRQPDYETLKKLADLFEVTTDYLLGHSDNPSPNKESKLNLFFYDGLEGYDDLDPEAQEAFRQYMREEAKRAIEFAKKLKKQGKRGGRYER
ncbi:Transcriptional regulator, contains XRE-family HTH domain [Aneurinibacillus thermoaerophilus]|uniref:Transcriptional regulator, contains XRE-family HTH domain n=1 Tax=Aneurinibacillus thermoaerophilus TaxID=143495 RepID=A0A1G8FPN3_ANETH|nr:helix-turn-helix transcriptional regulator [Aneurinibacillus thermoaerophilus]SDH84101.1 Transcriptional regulator, contains XRE-family HTH domain [Aneurinibacillus thermoaerophilus]